MNRVAIIGGGITGLTIAYAFEQHNRHSDCPIDYILIERANRLGGKVVSENIDGFVVEAGPDCFVSEKPWVQELASQLKIEDRLLGPNESSRRSYVLSERKIHELPEGLVLLLPTKITAFLLSPLVSWPGKLRMAADFILPRKKDATDETLSDFVKRRLGREILDKIAGPLVGGIHSNDPETMSLQASFPRFLQMEQEYGGLLRAMLAAKLKSARTKADGGRSHFLSFRQGMGELSGSLVSELNKERVLMGRTVVRLEKVRLRHVPEYKIYFENEHEPLQAASVVIAAVSNQAARILEGIDHSMADLLRQIPLTSSANLSMVFKTDELGRIPNGFGLMIPAVEKRKISALTISSTKWNYRVPDPSYSLLRIFVGGYRNQELALLDDNNLIKLVRGELSDIFGIIAKPTMTRIHRWIEERPQYTLGHIERVRKIESRLSEHEGLFLAGCSYHGIGVGDCIASGIKTAKTIIEKMTTLRSESNRIRKEPLHP